jgi:hypothetical protein
VTQGALGLGPSVPGLKMGWGWGLGLDPRGFGFGSFPVRT